MPAEPAEIQPGILVRQSSWPVIESRLLALALAATIGYQASGCKLPPAPSPADDHVPPLAAKKAKKNEFSDGASAYLKSFALAAGSSAQAVREGKITGKNDALAAIDAYRESVRRQWSSSLDAALDSISDQSGKFKSQVAAADVLDRISGALEVK